RFGQALSRHKDLQAVACLFVSLPIVCYPDTLKRTFQRVAPERITNEVQERTAFAPPDFRSVVAMVGVASDDNHPAFSQPVRPSTKGLAGPSPESGTATWMTSTFTCGGRTSIRTA